MLLVCVGFFFRAAFVVTTTTTKAETTECIRDLNRVNQPASASTQTTQVNSSTFQIRVSNKDYWGILVNCEKRRQQKSGGAGEKSEGKEYVISVLLSNEHQREVRASLPEASIISKEAATASEDVMKQLPCVDDKTDVVSVLLSDVQGISSVRLYTQKDVEPEENRKADLISMQVLAACLFVFSL